MERHVVSKKHDLNALSHDATNQEYSRKRKRRVRPFPTTRFHFQTPPLGHFATSPPSLVLRHPLRRRTIPISAPLPTMHHNRRLLRVSPSSSFNLLLHIWAILYVLAKVANVAAHFLVWLEREGDNGHEAECEPLPALGYLLNCVLVCVVRRGKRREEG
jgi:hypothetical protein